MLDVPESRLLHPFLRLTDGMVASVGGGDALDEVQQRGPPGRLGRRSSTGRTAVPTRTSTPMPPTPVPADTSTRTPARTPVPQSRTPMEGSAPTQPQSLARAPLSAPRATRTPATASAAPPFSRHPDRPSRSILVVNPVYPPADLKARIRGHVAIQVLVSETGMPLDIVVVERARGHLTGRRSLPSGAGGPNQQPRTASRFERGPRCGFHSRRSRFRRLTRRGLPRRPASDSQ